MGVHGWIRKKILHCCLRPLNLIKQSLKNNRTILKKNYGTNADGSTKNLKNDRTSEEKLLNERRRLKKGQDELSAERLLRTYLQHKYDKKLKKEIEGGSKKREEEKKINEKEKK